MQRTSIVKRGPIPKEVGGSDQELILEYLEDNYIIDKNTAHKILGYKPSNNINNYPRRVLHKLEIEGKIIVTELDKKRKIWISPESEHLIPLIFLKDTLPPEKFIDLVEEHAKIDNVFYVGDAEGKKITGYHYGTLKKLGLIKSDIIKINNSKKRVCSITPKGMDLLPFLMSFAKVTKNKKLLKRIKKIQKKIKAGKQ
ncbi:MAG: hypothetical protein ACTSRW_06360 [Candidatus Helarchaeota archaeon]